MAFDPIHPENQSQPAGTPPQPAAAPAQNPAEQSIRTMRQDLGATATPPAPQGGQTVSALPSFDAEEPAFTPETTSNATQVASFDQGTGQNKSHTAWLIGGIGIFIVLGLVGYFVVYPLLTKSPDANELASTPPAAPPAPPAAPGHKSQFVTVPADIATQTISIGENGALSLTEIKGALVTAASTAKPGVTEVVLTGPQGQAIPFGAVLKTLVPEVAVTDPSQIFEDDGTFFIFKDATGSWPGYASKVKSGVDTAALFAFGQQLEKSKLENFFIVTPGKLAAFKDGTVGTLADRYSSGATPGASFGYTTEKNVLLISTSFSGMKEAVRLMGL